MKVYCQDCGTEYDYGINRKCPNCGSQAIYDELNPQEEQISTTTLPLFSTETADRPSINTGLVCGTVVVSKNVLGDFKAALKDIIGGELKTYTKMMEKARATATQRMTDQAIQINADAIVSVRYSSAQVLEGACEIIAYGTAVKYINE